MKNWNILLFVLAFGLIGFLAGCGDDDADDDDPDICLVCG